MTPLVEARRDGRLDERERASIERHLASCAECHAREAGFARLAELARASADPATALEHHRGRMRLLQAGAVIESLADRGTLGGISAADRPAGPGWRVPLAAAALAVGMLLTVGYVRPRAAKPPAPAWAAAAPTATATATTATESEAPAPTVTAPEVHASPPPATAAASAAPAPISASTTIKRQVQTTRARPTAEPAAAAPPKDDADLKGGVGALARGNYGEAADRLSAFRRSHGNDPRAEDAAFLVVLALERAGKREAAAAAAREYLAAYPHGFRREEAAAIAAR